MAGKKLEEELDKSIADLEDSLDKGGEEEDAKSKKDEEGEDAKGKKEEEGEYEEAKGKKEDEDENAKGKKDEEDEDAKGKHEEGESAKEEAVEEAAKKKAKGKKEDEEEDAKGKKDDEEDMDAKGGKKEDEEDNKGAKKAKLPPFKETMKSDAAVKNTLEVSAFLSSLVDTLSKSLDVLSERIETLEAENGKFKKAMVKSMSASADLVKSLSEEIETFGEEPMARKSKTKTLEKGFRGNGGEEGSEESLTKSQVCEKLVSLEMDGKVPVGSATRYEVSGLMSSQVAKLIKG